MNSRTLVKLLAVTIFMFTASCATMPGDELDVRGYVSAGIFMPDDRAIDDAFGSNWLTIGVGGIGPLAVEGADLLGRAEIHFNTKSATESGYTYYWDNFIVRLHALMMLDKVRANDHEGPYIGAGFALYSWSYTVDDLSINESGSDIGVSVVIGYRFPTETEIDWFAELIYDIVSSSSSTVDDLGGISIVGGVIF